MANGDAGHLPGADGADGAGGSPDAPVWDGSAWVVPGTTWAWDGTRWIDRAAAAPPAAPPPPPPPPPPAPAAVAASAPTGPPGSPHPAPPPAGAPWAGPAAPAVSRGAVFGHVLWRVAVVCIVGGAAVGFLLIAVLLAFPDDGDGRAFSFLLVGPLFGGIFGAMLAVVAAPIIAGVCAAALVPYPGRAKCRLTVRLLGIGLVGLFLLLVLFDTSLELGVLLLVAGIWAASLAGAWFGSPWVIGWYVRRCEPTPT